jgi:hypothetical protein
VAGVCGSVVVTLAGTTGKGCRSGLGWRLSSSGFWRAAGVEQGLAERAAQSSLAAIGAAVVKAIARRTRIANTGTSDGEWYCGIVVLSTE